jgi:hypothetical protein
VRGFLRVLLGQIHPKIQFFFTFSAFQTMNIHHNDAVETDLSSKTAAPVSEVFKRLRLFI